MNWFENLATFRGVGFTALSIGAFLMCMNRIIVKTLMSPPDLTVVEPISNFYVMAVRQFVIFLSAVPFASITEAPLVRFPPKIWALLLLRALLSVTTIAFTNLAVASIPLPDHVAISALAPLVTSILSWTLLRERLTVTDVFLFLLMLAGVIFMVQPGMLFNAGATTDVVLTRSPTGWLCSVAALFGMCFISILMRKLREVPVASIYFVYGTSTFFVACIVNLLLSDRPFVCLPLLRAKTFLAGLTSASHVAFAMLATKSLPAAFTSLGAGIELIIQLLLDVAFFQASPSFYTMIGAMEVLTAISLLFLKNYLANERSSSKENEPKNKLK